MAGPSVVVRLYVLTVGALGTALLLYLFPTSIDSPYTIIMLLLFSVLVLLADLNPVWLPRGAIVSVSTALNFSNTLLFGPAWASWAGVMAVAVADLWQRRPWYKVVFNIGCTALSLGLAGLAYFALHDGSSLPLSSLQNIFAATVYTITTFALNTSLLALAIGLDQQISPLEVWMANSFSSLLQFGAMIPIGMLIANTYLQNTTWSSLLLVLPLIMVYHSLRTSQVLRSQTRSVIEALADVVDKRDPYTYRHSQEVAELAEGIARRMGLSLEEQEAIVLAARVHDLGKIGVRDAVLLKKGSLEPSEIKEMRKHPEIGAEILSRLPFYRRHRQLILYHQERYDGKGYPQGLRGEEIPLGARIIAVADAYQAMTSNRPYRAALSREQAIAELLAGKGTQFDPVVVDAFLAMLAEEQAIRAEDTAPMPRETTA